MRTLVFAAGFSLSVFPALAAAADRAPAPPPPAASLQTPLLSLKMRAIPPLPPQPDVYLPVVGLDPYGSGVDNPLKASTVTPGPLSARLGGTTKRTNLAHYRLEGMDVLGGSVSGTLDTRGARIYLRWPPNDDE